MLLTRLLLGRQLCDYIKDIKQYPAHQMEWAADPCPVFLFVILLSLLDTFFLVSEVPVDDVETQSANHKYR